MRANPTDQPNSPRFCQVSNKLQTCSTKTRSWRASTRSRRNLSSGGHKLLLMKKCIKTSDISSEDRPMEISEFWFECLITELFNQADHEKWNGLSLMGRDKFPSQTRRLHRGQLRCKCSARFFATSDNLSTSAFVGLTTSITDFAVFSKQASNVISRHRICIQF